MISIRRLGERSGRTRSASSSARSSAVSCSGGAMKRLATPPAPDRYAEMAWKNTWPAQAPRAGPLRRDGVEDHVAGAVLVLGHAPVAREDVGVPEHLGQREERLRDRD